MPIREPSASSLEGQLLIAMPTMTDQRFVRSVIYMCAHSDDGAMGLIINQRAPNLSFVDLLDRLDILPSAKARIKGTATARNLGDRPVHVGGPVETGRGFVLHSPDYQAKDATLAINKGVCLTATVEILKAIASGRGPDRSILALGYAGWSPGQLESELQANGWLNCMADPELVFAADLQTKYDRALAKLGINPSHLVAAAGHA
ncbi:MAG: YqgE/AlgH family protein [Hyphomicrobiaceae bacterium]|nr:YqgE/AlgH family protein [Hyphomicrobiaceae bacterium]